MSEKTVLNALPKLPGFNIQLNPPTSFNRSQGLTFVKGEKTVKEVVDMPLTTVKDDAKIVTGRFNYNAIMARFPEWGSLDGKVLRFYGYFTEPISESSVENARVRRVVVNHYLADGTTSVVETPEFAGKSGMRGGCIMSRDRLDGVTAESLDVGAMLPMRGQNIVLVDADPFTRAFYDKFGMSVGPKGQYPTDSFEKTTARQLSREKRPDEDYAVLKTANEMAAAVANGHPINIMTAADREKAQNYFTHDEILKFFAVHNRRDFHVLFFLSDMSVAITEAHAPNDGRDQLASFVRRGRVPRGSYVMKALDTIARQRHVAEDYLSPEDLRTGTTIQIYGRDYFLYDVDAFTRKYYDTKLNMDQNTSEKPPSEMDGRSLPKRPTELPPYTGYGSEEDSLASWKRLVGKPPRKDTAKFIRHVNDVLRFGAEIQNPKPEDTGRQFIVCYFLADDTISVFEYAVRNSGHAGGKAFSRTAVKEITPKSMFVGAVLKLGGQNYVLTEIDERTQTFIDTGVSMGAVKDTIADDVLARLRQCLTQRFSRVTEAYRHFNVSKRGLGISDLKRMFSECEVKVEDADLLAECMRCIDLDQDGVISLQEFVENLLRQNLVAPSDNSTVRSPRNMMSAEAFSQTQVLKQQRDKADDVLKKFIIKLDARRAYIIDTFRIVSDRSVDGLIDVPTFKRAVQDRLALRLTDDEMDSLVFRFFYADDMPDFLQRRLSLKEFRRVIDQCA